MNVPANRRVDADTRPIVFRTRGRSHGPITRLMSPGDLGQWRSVHTSAEALAEGEAEIERIGSRFFTA